MSSEPSNTAEGGHSDPAPMTTKAPSKGSTAADNLKATRLEEKRVIRCILPGAKNDTELYEKVIVHIKSSKICHPKRWRESGFVRNFIGWLAMSKQDVYPDLASLVAVLAILDCYSNNAQTKLRTELTQRRLREWAIRKLESGRASTEQVSPEAPQAPQKATEVKQETILPSIEMDEITPCASSTSAQGLKRQAEHPPTEHPPKRMVPDSNDEALAARVTRIEKALTAPQSLPAHRQGMSSRHFGTQTSPPPTESTVRLPSSVTEQLAKHSRALAEQGRALVEHGRALVDLPSTIRAIVRQETRDTVHQEIQRAIAPLSSDADAFQRSQGHGQPYTFIANQATPSYSFDNTDEFQMVEAPQGRSAGRSRFNSRFFQPGVFDFDLRR
ncbi:hypothetical protein N0V84_003192 [Fusarium piperis]|uniref:Uncharacterized protein n=1 Tax=Fusarium piperis TaxID=1435070 RepID=A0A9W8WHV2_9HYPO|nr:hypothetical protein N0V84_003192 [Fusarium piperis]